MRSTWLALSGILVHTVAATAQLVPAPAARGEKGTPRYGVDASFPKALPNQWILGQVSGVAIGPQDHVWIVHRPTTLTPTEIGAAQNPPWSQCCRPAPAVIEFDPAGNVVRGWGGPDSVQADSTGTVRRTWHKGERWPQSEHGIAVDGQGKVWIASNGALDHVVLKFSPDGRRLLTIGQWDRTGGSNDTTLLGGPAEIDFDMAANEVYVADGYRNRRIIVFDMTTGKYQRHWGAYGKTPSDSATPRYNPSAPAAQQFRTPVHTVRIGNDNLVYVADRVNNRIQVFRKNGEFVKEATIEKMTLSMGSAWDIDFNPGDQRFMFVSDGTNKKIWILNRADLKLVGEFGQGGRNAGFFGWLHSLAIDSRGNIYTTEVDIYKRVQKFSPMGVMPELTP